jgi:hypothetical protein
MLICYRRRRRNTLIIPSDDEPGLLATYWNNTTYTNPSVLTQIEERPYYPSLEAWPRPGVNNVNFSAKWVGVVKPEKTATYLFSTISDDGSSVFISGIPLIENTSTESAALNTATEQIELIAGKKYAIEVRYLQGNSGGQMSLRWQGVNGETGIQVIPAECFFQDEPTEVALLRCSASSQLQSYWGAKYAFDGSLGSKWVSNFGAFLPQWIERNFAAPTPISAVAITTGDIWPGRDILAFTLQGSDDGVTYTDIQSFAGITWQFRLQRQVFLLSGVFTYRRYRLVVTNNVDNEQAHIVELELYVHVPVVRTDDFSSPVLDDAWSPLNSAFPVDAVIADGKISIKSTVAGSVDLGRGGFGLKRDLPATGSWRIEATIDVVTPSNDAYNGIFMANHTNGEVLIEGPYSSYSSRGIRPTAYSETVAWGAWDGGDYYYADMTPKRDYFMEYDEGLNVVRCGYKGDDALWHLMLTRTVSARPTRCGLSMWSNLGGGAGVLSNNTVICEYFDLQEIQFPLEITASSSNDAGPNVVFDRNPNNRWVTAYTGPPAWVQVRYAAPKMCARVMIQVPFEDVPQRDPRDFTIQGSEDGVTWTTLGTFLNVIWDVRGQIKYFPMANPQAFSRLRIYITANYGAGGADPYTNLAEMKFLSE